MGTPLPPTITAAPCSYSFLASASAQNKNDFGIGSFGGAPARRPDPPKVEPPLWFVPSAGSPNTAEKWEAEGALSSTQIHQSPTSEIFIPESAGHSDICIFFAPPQPQRWQLGKGLPFTSKSCSEGCCFYIPASSRLVQEEEAKNEQNLFEWFRTTSGSCSSSGNTYLTRIILNNNNGDEANICAKQPDNTFKLLTGDAIACKGQCCGFGCKSCREN